MKKLTVLSLLFFVNIAPAVRSQETYDAPVRAAFEFSNIYSSSAGFKDGHLVGYIDVNLGNQTRRIWQDEAVKLTCWDNEEREHPAWMLPGSKVQPITMDTFVILDMLPYQCRPGSSLSFRGDVGAEVYYRVLFVTGPRGQMVVFDPQ